MYRILIVEDEENIASSLAALARSWGMEARAVADFRRVMEDFAEFAPHLVLLDIALPFFNGYHWCGEIRRVSGAPIMFISSASDNMNIVMAMNLGADDFIAKPFDPDVLMAKINALLRRAYDLTPPAAILEHRGAKLNVTDGTLTVGDGTVDLTKNEFRILLTLMENRGKIVSRDTLMERLWKTRQFVDENTLTVNINRLRRKLDGAGLADFIVTKVGMGYIVE